jgi:cytochrome c biogenesis protein CcmG, thiol:disulfide interchange protein DsbE
MRRFLLPLFLFIGLLVFLGIGLTLNPREVPSPLIGKSAPAFTLSQLGDAEKNFAPQDLKGQVWLLNAWASWCVSCREEHPVLVEFSKKNLVPIVGLNYKDTRDAGNAWLAKLGNPYTLSVFDVEGKVFIDYGMYGVPETFVIDKQGIIRLKHTGPVTPEVLAKKLLPLINDLKQKS